MIAADSTSIAAVDVVAADTESIDITAVTRLKHADLWQACKKFCHGRYGGQSGLARHLGVKPAEVGLWLNLRACPPEAPTRFWSSKRLATLESKLIELTGKTLEQLFPKELRASVAFLRTPKVYERTASVRIDAMERYAIATTERMRIAAEPCIAMETQEMQKSVWLALECLEYRERELIKLRYGLADGYQYTMEEVGSVFGISRERVRQIEVKALRKLNRPRAQEILAGHMP
jgi:RNA polymerase sigma factor (sigma-70 family)